MRIELRAGMRVCLRRNFERIGITRGDMGTVKYVENSSRVAHVLLDHPPIWSSVPAADRIEGSLLRIHKDHLAEVPFPPGVNPYCCKLHTFQARNKE